jgi:hypothetical protein
MHKTVFSIMAATLVVATAALTSPAAATDTSKALSICVSRGPDCTATNKGDHLQLCVNNTGGQQCVNCPNVGDTGKCTVARTGGTGGGKVNVSGVAGILQGGNKVPPARKTGLSGPPTGLLESTPGSGPTGPAATGGARGTRGGGTGTLQ